jgi:retron-type reverse transcriptase
LAIFLDIKGAFNSITFKAAIGAMRKRGFPKNFTNWYNQFLHNQESTLELDNCRFTRKLETGTPQGGVVSPIVWNVSIDPILKKLNTNKPVKVIGFADDVVIMVTGCDPSVMVRRVQPSINAMVEWGKESGLEFNTDKTVVVMFTQKKTTIQDYHEKV